MKQFFLKLIYKLRRREAECNFTCDLCGEEVFDNERICARCFPRLPWVGGVYCPFCGRKVAEAGTCTECKEKPLKVEKARSCFTHEGEAMALVHRFKRGTKYLRYTFAEVMLPVLREEFSGADALTFVPMTKRAERKRGYNQSRLLAEELSVRSGIAVIAPAVKRKETAQQKSLTRREREGNLEGAFFITDRKAVKGRSIVIIDDTMTTGSTASELADRLKRAGAKRVFLLTVTSVQKKNPYGTPPKIK